MRIRSNVVVLFSVLTLAACGGSSPGAKEPDPWADFKGTYAGSAAPRGDTSAASSSKGEAASRDAKSATPKEQAEETPAAEAAEPEAPPAKAAPAKKAAKPARKKK